MKIELDNPSQKSIASLDNIASMYSIDHDEGHSRSGSKSSRFDLKEPSAIQISG